ncbi:hypothetical protein GLOIN_2v1567646 [Rhizophagus irregularis DAOM 181602=DAOM 197198]|uniref:Uncharacterized protein n=1 Tax=Rhizophagus irregularis (strain DAOM 181602 / DAOM 197198 / MUCL 43194) TaxID=747089 RepID=A0A2P4QC48_RHIID|nr:hypothetical protein GLOIN_2v1567646 [Rhizophagus irregularis DAOM 181602=DAOM 197198]POG75202.1 hypothetical protein GLOIN_2v1567646 [Rhizophagus irregularis DAOM 181602=DAOM 197198]|eukprot:XP_025182068.1 hypothetical protein GLOIN_2v1567646 [Rhizophagus irregularis DAOM 181602=DAOM 197198]
MKNIKNVIHLLIMNFINFINAFLSNVLAHEILVNSLLLLFVLYISVRMYNLMLKSS